MSRFLADSRPQCDPVFHSVSNFYREEFVKCKRCLEQQREYYSEDAITDVEKALTKVMSQLDRLCTKADADQVVAGEPHDLCGSRRADWSRSVSDPGEGTDDPPSDPLVDSRRGF